MKTQLFVADDIQALASQKVLIVGLYSDATIVIEDRVPSLAPPPTPAGAGGHIALHQLALMLTVLDLPAGRRLVPIELLDSEGAPIPSQAAPLEIETRPGQHNNLMLVFRPFVLAKPGRVRLVATFDGERIEHEFRVLLASQAGEAAPPLPA